MRRLELAAYVLLATAIAAGLVVTVVHARDEVYAIPGYGVAIAAGGAVVAAAGIALAWRSRRGRAVTLAAVAGVLVVLAVLSFPPLLVLVAAIAAIAVRTARGAAPGRAAAAIAGGTLLGIGLHVVALVALSPPLVDCASGRAGENVFLGLRSHSSTGTASSGGDGRTRGRLRGDAYELSYACRGDDLVEFELRDR
ncbi:MAG TPA: hypothetical protein VGO80_23925 [Solirubrobacteraceae bacterium]|jgi:hypothetical protein|nr:hypothetical protein [Solirubrobacteraceae bacterium]